LQEVIARQQGSQAARAIYLVYNQVVLLVARRAASHCRSDYLYRGAARTAEPVRLSVREHGAHASLPLSGLKPFPAEQCLVGGRSADGRLRRSADANNARSSDVLREIYVVNVTTFFLRRVSSGCLEGVTAACFCGGLLKPRELEEQTLRLETSPADKFSSPPPIDVIAWGNSRHKVPRRQAPSPPLEERSPPTSDRLRLRGAGRGFALKTKRPDRATIHHIRGASSKS